MRVVDRWPTQPNVMFEAAAAAIRMAVLYAPSTGVVVIASAIPMFTAAALGILGGVNGRAGC